MATLLQKYQSFLARPVATQLSDNASIVYTTTAEVIQGRDALVKHFEKYNQLFAKRTDKQISVVETQDTLVYETDTLIEFRTGGGSFLPGLDDNFLADQTVNFVLIHIVEFRGGLVQQVRLYWDQSTLLKQLGVIGRSGRNWPIKEGLEQIKVVSRAVSGLPEKSGSTKAAPSGRVTRSSSKASEQSQDPATPRRDPRGNLDLFSPVKEPEEDGPRHRPAVVPAVKAHKPPNRGLGEIIGSEDDRSAPPQVNFTPKAKSKYGTTQQFSFGDQDDIPVTPQRPYISRPKHKEPEHQDFLFGESSGEDTPAAKPKHRDLNQQKWDATDVQTPEKIPIRDRPSDERHYHFSDDEVMESPVKLPRKIVPRKDATSHFELTDESPAPRRSVKEINQSRTSKARANNGAHFDFADESPVPLGDKTNRSIIGRNTGKGVYFENPIFAGEEDDAPAETKRSYASNTNTRANIANRNASWGVYDEEPATPQKPENKRGTVRPSDKHFDFTDESPAGTVEQKRRTVGGARSANDKHFDFADESPAPSSEQKRRTANAPSRATDKHFNFEDESPAISAQQKRENQKSQATTNRMKQTGGDFWDF